MKRYIALIIVFIIINSSFIHVNGNTRRLSDRDRGYEDGYLWGEVEGAIRGQRDRINDRRSDWRRAYRDEEKDIVERYNLDDEARNYRLGFLDGYQDGFKDGYEDAYDQVTGGRRKNASELGEEHGRFFGGLLGAKRGRDDFYSKRSVDWRRGAPSEATIRSGFNLANDTNEYAAAFIRGYRIGYEEEYLYAYRDSNYEGHKLTREDGIDHGFEVGETTGEAYAMMDYMAGVANSWESALRSLENEASLISRYKLFGENQQYQLGFINGFKEGFRGGYIKLYQEFNRDMAQQNINYKKITMTGDIIEFEDTVVHFNQGSQSTETRKVVELEIPPATIYEESYISLQRHEYINYMNHSPYIPVGKAYEIKIINNNANVRLRNPIKLTFQYAGSYRGGIYEWKNNGWQYLYSEVSDGEISAEISSDTYQGGVYAVFIDENYVELRDIYTHWARQELYTFIRRGYIAGYNDGTFKPNQTISRGEFVVLLNRILNWQNVRTNETTIQFDDVDDFGVFRQAINVAIARGFVAGYPDNTFKPHNPITYQEIEWLMQRVIRDTSFRWNEIAEKMLYEKYTRSNSRLGMDNNITRAEVIYMLYELQKNSRL